MPSDEELLAERAVRHVLSALYERHDAFKGYDKNPFTGEKRALQSPCPHCRISPKGLEEDIRTLVSYEMSLALHEAEVRVHIEEIEDIGQSRDIETDPGGIIWCTSCEMCLEDSEDQLCGCDHLYEKRKQRLEKLRNELAILTNEKETNK